MIVEKVVITRYATPNLRILLEKKDYNSDAKKQAKQKQKR